MNDDVRIGQALDSPKKVEREAPKSMGEAFQQLNEIFRKALAPLAEFDVEEMQYRAWRSKDTAARYSEVLLAWAHFMAGVLLSMMGVWLIAFVFMVLIVATIELTAVYINGDIHRALTNTR